MFRFRLCIGDNPINIFQKKKNIYISIDVSLLSFGCSGFGGCFGEVNEQQIKELVNTKIIFFFLKHTHTHTHTPHNFSVTWYYS